MARTTGPAWLDDAIFYQIYPQSFRDSNGDGIGDLPGVAEKLDHVAALGCNAIWLNPCFVSPFMDAGYDVADYYRVAPRYGTNADLRRLFREAAKRGIRIFLDLVPGHTSIEHPWFQASCRHERNKYSDWYVWTDSVWSGGPRNLIRGYAERDGCFMTNFFWCQPSLNFGVDKPIADQPWRQLRTAPGPRAVRAEILKIMRHWLDMGAAGFRVDMALSIGNSYWSEVRAMLDREYPEAALVSEASNPLSSIPSGFHMDFLAQFGAPVFSPLIRHGNWPANSEGEPFFSRRGRGDAEAPVREYLRHLEGTWERGHICLQSGNHDTTRLSWDRTREEIEVAFAFFLTMPGVPYVYYGDEIGMRFLPDLPSKEGGYNRTGSRTPMQWTAGRNAGFSSAPARSLYLPLDPAADRPNVSDQERDPGSLLHAVRRLTALRHATPALRAGGTFRVLHLERNAYPLVYERQLGRERVIVALNPSGRAASATFSVAAAPKPRTHRRAGARRTPNAQRDASPQRLAGHGATLTMQAGRATVELAGTSYGIFLLEANVA